MAVALVMGAVVGVADYHAPAVMSLAMFYVIPITLATWVAGWRGGMALAVTCAAVNLLGDWISFSRDPEVASVIAVWNAISRLAIYSILVILLGALRRSVMVERVIARTDPNTGAANARALFEYMAQVLEEAGSSGGKVSAAFIDLDNFKSVNDRHGHAVGDRLLRAVAGIASEAAGGGAMVARWGGDEFVIVMAGADAARAREVAERVLARLPEATGGLGVPVTCSVGLITTGPTALSAEELFVRADELMYRAKKAGKNRIETA